MKAIDFQKNVQDSFKKYFPNGHIGISRLQMGNEGISIFCGLIGDINDVISKIRMNDPLTFRAFIHDSIIFNDDTIELENVVIEFQGCWISVLPDNPHMYCQSHKIRTRKINDTPEKAIIKLDKLFSTMKETVQEQAALNRIIQQSTIDLKYLQ